MYDKLEEVIRKIKKECGISIFENDTQLLNAYYDFGNGLPKHMENMFSMFIKCDGTHHLMVALKNPYTAEIEIRKAAMALSVNFPDSDQICLDFCTAIYNGLADTHLSFKTESNENIYNQTQILNENPEQQTFGQNSSFSQSQYSYNSQPGFHPNVSVSEKKDHKKLLTVLVLVLGIIVLGAGYFIISSQYNSHLISKAESCVQNGEYEDAVVKYAKAAQSDENLEAYTGMMDSLVLYLCNEDTLEFSNKKFSQKDIVQLANEGKNLFASSDEFYDSKERMDLFLESQNILVEASNCSDASQAEDLYSDVLADFPNHNTAKKMYDFNHLEMLIQEQDWDEVDDWMKKNSNDFTEERQYFLNDMKVDSVEEKQFGLYISQNECYSGMLKDNGKTGSGVRYTNLGTSQSGFCISQGEWKKDAGNGSMTFMEMNQKTSAGNRCDMLYDGIVIDGLFNGTVFVSWDDGVNDGSGKIKAEKGKIIPLEKFEEDGKTYYYYIEKDEEDYDDWYLTKDGLNDFGIY